MKTAQLERECRAYTRYLIGQVPSRYVIERYLDFHRKSNAIAALRLDRFDQFLVWVSARRPLWARLADSYTSVFRKNSAVRKKLVLTLALLECTPPYFETLDQVGSGGPFGAVMRLSYGAIQYALTLGISVTIFTFARVITALSSRPDSAAVMER